MKLRQWFLDSSLPRYLIYTATITAIAGGSLGAHFLYWLAGIFAAAATLWAAEQNSYSTALLHRQSEEIQDLTTRNAALVTGGDSFCYLEISNLDEGKNAGMCVVVQQGGYPLYGVSARVVDLHRFAQLPEKTAQSVFGEDLMLEIGDMAAGSATLALEKPLVLGKSDARDFNIFFSARNGFFHQQLRFRRRNGEWLCKTVVIRDGETIFEKEDPGYPSDKPDSTQQPEAPPGEMEGGQ